MKEELIPVFSGLNVVESPPWGADAKWMTSSLMMYSPSLTVIEAPTVCAAATDPINPRSTDITFVEPNPTESTLIISSSICINELVKIEVIPISLMVVLPIPTLSASPTFTSENDNGDWTVPSIVIIHLVFWFNDLKVCVPIPTPVISK